MSHNRAGLRLTTLHAGCLVIFHTNLNVNEGTAGAVLRGLSIVPGHMIKVPLNLNKENRVKIL